MTYPNGKKALRDFTADLSSPNMIGLVGPNGAGKSTLMKLLVAGLLPTSGSIQVDGKSLKSQEKRLKAGLGYLPQNFGLYDELTVRQFIDYMAALKGIGEARTRAIDAVLEQTNLVSLQKTRIQTLSGGQRQRVGIAQALLGNPELLIFDEPTVGLDPEERINFRNLFSQSARDKTVILSTHIIEDVQSVCGRLIVLYQGKLRFDGTPEALIRMAESHVGVMEQAAENPETSYQITARINTARGIQCRIVAPELPPYARIVDPTLEDAYMYLIGREEKSA
ncbi:MAG: ATP-binding cassette domain-containing protein [Oscillospiraceae bacterium]|jgi:ABC-type multidrug transport system ATPase subunit|nr:ATP-binding cassette domain-containing protein [Oscillospiraceae bacterium]